MRYFSAYELQCKCGCGLFRLHPSFDIELDILREQFGRPLVIRSACRCKKHNDTPAADGGAGGHVRSLHVADLSAHADKGQAGCLAVDVSTPDGTQRGYLFSVAWKLGWSIGWNSDHEFLHLDRRVMIGMPQTTFDY